MNESTNLNSLDHLAHEFAERLRRGERPTVEEYAEQHPHLAAEIRDFLPTLMLMEAQLTPASSPSSPRTDTSWPRELPSQLGDYRILREVGRGGMGVVYEAVQETLGRHVALKVMPPRHMSNVVDVERFRREARAAAQLHHTNIVPVFDVGEADGVHFYAMQFIDGQPLNQLLDGTQRRSEHHSQFALGVAHWQAAQQAEIDALANCADQSRGIGFQPVETAENHDRLEAYPTSPDTEPVVLPLSDTPSQASTAGQSADDGGAPEHRRVVSTSAILSGSRHQHYLHVARIGKQVAEALAYAHGQGVLHRDIKPANLLLDSTGVVWIADFGLARVEGLDELTSPGDVVGTLRYLPPERFEGHSDERGDIYGVGITLYELLTSRPAFTASSRATLIDNILHTSPLSPRRIDPHIPRDLQTIVLKAMAADPSQRYARAEALAADLNRFIEDRPILARRLSPWGHTWRWCRRNKAVAALISLAAALLVVVAVVSLVSSFRLREQLEQTIAAQREVRKQLFDSLVVQARANWRSGIDGKRFQTLKVLRDATRIAHELELPRESFDQLRNEAIAALCLTDVEIAQTVDAYPTGSGMVDFDPQFERYARGYVEGHVTIHRISDNRILHRLPSPGPGLGVTKYFDGVVFSPNGQYLSQHCFGGDRPGHLRLWEVSGPEPRIVFDKPDGIVGTALAGSAFRPDSRQLAVVMTDPPPNENSAPAAAFGVHVFDTASGRECVSPLRADATTTIVYHPWISRLAVSDASAMRIVDLDTGAELSRWEYPNAICLAWSPDGRQLFAASESDRGIHRWDIANQRELSPLPGHRDSNAYAITFSHAGDLVVTLTFNGWRLWEFRSGRLVWDSPEGSTLHMRFSRDDRLLAATHGVIPTMRLLRVASGQEIQRLPLEAWNAGSSPGSVLSGDGRMLAATSRDSITLIDVLRGNELAIIPGYRIPLAFEPDGSLLTFAKLPDGVARWPLITDSSRRERITLGPKQQLTAISTEGAFGGGHTWSTSADGRVIAVPNCFHGSNVFVATSTDDSPTHEYRCIELGPQHDVQHVSVSPDGRWVAAGSRNLLANPTDSLTTTIWESARGKRIKDFPNLGIPKFSPDGKWLAVGSSSFAGSVGVWNVGPWMPGPTVESIAGPGIGPGNANVAFGPNSQLMAVECYSFIRLVNPATGREVARLAIPDATQLVPQCFTPDGTRLIAFGLNNGQLYIWDLRAIREQLAELGLDRNAPTYDPAPSAELPPALEVEVVP